MTEELHRGVQALHVAVHAARLAELPDAVRAGAPDAFLTALQVFRPLPLSATRAFLARAQPALRRAWTRHAPDMTPESFDPKWLVLRVDLTFAASLYVSGIQAP